MFEQYFPWGIAEGKAFLGREEAMLRLKANLARGVHTLLLAPRRYGKTSLAKHVLAEMDYPWVEIDLFIVQDEASIGQKILKGIQEILGQINKPEQWISSLVNYFKKADKTWTVGIKGLKLELTPENYQDVPENILEGLNALEHLLEKKKQRAVIFFDEFQEITNVNNNRAIEGAIRHFAQSAKYLTFIFSGSSRTMLKHMFSDQSRPLYALCDEINLERLPAEEYRPYLNQVAKKTWQQNLLPEVFDEIMELTGRHPRYVYNLCFYLWDYCANKKNGPEVIDVETVWQNMIADRQKDVREILIKRSSGQIKILTLLAKENVPEISGQYAQAQLGMSGSAIVQALKILEQEDYVERQSNGVYVLLDPLLKATLMQAA